MPAAATTFYPEALRALKTLPEDNIIDTRPVTHRQVQQAPPDRTGDVVQHMLDHLLGCNTPEEDQLRESLRAWLDLATCDTTL